MIISFPKTEAMSQRAVATHALYYWFASAYEFSIQGSKSMEIFSLERFSRLPEISLMAASLTSDSGSFMRFVKV